MLGPWSWSEAIMNHSMQELGTELRSLGEQPTFLTVELFLQPLPNLHTCLFVVGFPVAQAGYVTLKI